MATKSKRVKARGVRRRPKTPVRAVPLPAGDRAVLLHVARELMQETLAMLDESDLTREERARIYKLASSGRRLQGRPARIALQRSSALAELLTHWQRDKRYTDAYGTPKVLRVKGRGATLATLAKHFVPDMPLREVVPAIVRHGEVIRMKGERVALLGTSMIVPPKTSELTLALLTLGIQRLKSAILRNVSLPPTVKNRGSLQRFVTGRLQPEAFDEWSREVRPQLQRLIYTLDSGLKSKSTRARDAQDSGVAMFVFRDE